VKSVAAFGFVPGRNVVIRLLVILLGLLALSTRAQEPPPAIAEFFDAIKANDTNQVTQMLAGNTNLTRALYYGRLPLHIAASEGRGEIVALLLKYGADLNAPGDTLDTSNNQLTALDAAIWYNHPAVCKQLLAAGANPNILSPGQGSALHFAFTYHRDDMASWLLDHGADPFLGASSPGRSFTPFALAITISDGKLVPRMLRESRLTAAAPKPGAELLLDGKPPALKPSAAQFLAAHSTEMLIAAMQRGELEAVEALLEAGVSAKGTTPEGAPLIQPFALSVAAAQKGKDFKAERWTRIRALLEKNGARCDALAATGLGDLETARRLLSAEPNVVRATDPLGQTPLHWSVLTDRLPLTSFWLEAGASPAATDLSGQTALHLAAALGLPQQVERLLAAQAPTTARDTNGWTPLDAAIHANQPETIRLLLTDKSGAPHPERGIATSLHQAAAAGDLIALATFVNATNLEARNELGLTPLHLAAKAGQLGAAALLLDKGADVNARDPDGNPVLHLIILSPTHWIAGQPSAAWVERLKQEPRKQKFVQVYVTPSGYTSAHEVARSIAFFLACGADATATNNAGQTILQLAMQEGAMLFEEDRAALLSLLRQSGGGLDQRDANADTALHRAAHDPISGDKAVELIAAGADVNASNRLGRTPLHLSVEHLGGWPDSALEAILKAKPNVNAPDNEGLTALHVLAMSDSSFKKEATRALLDAGANPNAQDKHGRTPVHLLLTGKQPWYQAEDCLAMLVQAGADLSLTDDQGQTPLHYLAALGPQGPLFFIRGVTNSFASPKVIVSARDHLGNTPLHIAARTGTSDVFGWLRSRGASVEATNNAGETPRLLAARFTNPFVPSRFGPDMDIVRAAQEGNLETMTVLLKEDPALVNHTNQFGQFPLRAAVQAHRTNVVAFLEAKGARWDELTAVLAGRADVLRQILAREPNVLTNTYFGRCLLHLAAADGNVEVTRLLLDKGSDLRVPDAWGLSPLGVALLQNRTGVADLLASLGATENIFDAVYSGHLQTANALLAREKALARATNSFGASALEVAARTGREDMLKLLLDKGAPADWAAPRSGWTALHVAAFFNQARAAELLIRRGASVEAADGSGLVPLHLAAARGSTDVAALLLKHKSDPNRRVAPSSEQPRYPMGPRQSLGRAGDTPLHLAALFEQTNVIPVLLKAGASINATNSAGSTALDLVSFSPRAQGMFRMQRSFSTALDPPGFGESAQISSFGMFPQRQRAVASLLENAGAKRSLARPPGPGPPGF
jgi:cytohesin